MVYTSLKKSILIFSDVFPGLTAVSLKEVSVKVGSYIANASSSYTAVSSDMKLYINIITFFT